MDFSRELFHSLYIIITRFWNNEYWSIIELKYLEMGSNLNYFSGQYDSNLMQIILRSLAALDYYHLKKIPAEFFSTIFRTVFNDNDTAQFSPFRSSFCVRVHRFSLLWNVLFFPWDFLMFFQNVRTGFSSIGFSWISTTFGNRYEDLRHLRICFQLVFDTKFQMLTKNAQFCFEYIVSAISQNSSAISFFQSI